MAVPSPQTPSVLYGTVKIASGVTQFVELKGNKYLVVTGALSRSYIDIPYYDGGNYRDNVDAASTGRSPVSIVKLSGSLLTPPTLPFNGDLLVQSADETPVIETVAPDEIATMMQQDDNFTHTPPHPELHARTKVQWWNNAVPASGEEVAWAWLDRIEMSGNRIPQSNGSVPPTYTP